MNLWQRILTGLGVSRHDDGVAEELEAHRAHTQDELERAGWTPAAAAAESRRRMGNALLAREDSREVWIIRWLDRLKRNVRYGARGLRREPTFATTAILTLALGTAAVTSVFSVVDSELWRPLPFADPRALVSIRSVGPEPRRDNDSIGLDEFLEWRQTMPALSSVAAEASTRRRTVRHAFTEAMQVSEVTANYFTTFGRRPLIGRVFGDDDARGSHAVVLGSRVWKTSFESDPAVVGRTLLIDDEPRTVVGVVQTVDVYGSEPGVFVPVDERPGAANGGRTFYGAVGRLAPGATADIVRQQAQAEFDRRALVERSRAGHTADVEDYTTFNQRSDGRPLYFFLAASVFVLVLTIVNLAGLVLARGVRRAPEFALRGALGGGSRLIASQLAAEAALIAVPGCALGLWLTRQAMGLLGTVVPADVLWRGTAIAVDYRAAAVVAAIVLVTIAGLALAPLGVARRADASVVKASGTRASELSWAGRVRERLLIGQVALTVVLLVGGALFLKSFLALTRVPLGFDAADGWSAHVSLSGDRYRDMALVKQYADTLLDQARAIPGVREAAIGTSTPLMSGWLVIANEPGAAPEAEGTSTIYRAVTDTYFHAIGTPITRGRGLTAADLAGSPNVAVVNEEFVHRFFHDTDPIGRDVAIKGLHAPVPLSTVTVVGVAANIKEVGLNEVTFADMYVPFSQKPAGSLELIVRGNGASEGMPASLREAAAKADPAIPVTGVAPISRRITVALAEDRFNLVLAGSFAVVALLIAAIGIYGAMAYAAVARSREFGVRLALGASPRVLLGNALWHAARVGLLGGAAGVALAIGCAVWIGDALYLVPRVHNGLLFGVKTTDPVALAAAAGGVLLVALIAGFLPARRLARVDPVRALRAE